VFDTNIGKIFFIGIGGIGMSGIAEVLANLGFDILGSDNLENPNIARLRKIGIKINIGHSENNIKNIAIVVISSAINDDNIELIEARKKRIPIVKRAEMLAELMRFKKTIAVAGTHGKTTTTSIMATVLDKANYDPTVINGGVINSYNSNAKIGFSDWMVVEADESDGSFLKLPSTHVIVTNIDAEHLDFYNGFKELKEAFKKFINNIPFYGVAIVCIDNPTIQSIISEIDDKKIITYGLSPQADYRATNILFKDSKTYFSLEISPKKDASAKRIENMISNIPGIHNVQNILAVCSMAVELGINLDTIKIALERFEGVNRRFSLIKNYNGIKIYDDYGHHPAEIKATLAASREITKGKVIAIVQPHRYTRLKLLFEDFTSAFNDADTIFITEIYSAGEFKNFDLNNFTLINSLISAGHKDVRAYNDVELKNLIKTDLKEGDIIVFLGAGDISAKAREFVNKKLLQANI
jgi:UDP-N-acetylmuramate--alanine ligase